MPSPPRIELAGKASAYRDIEIASGGSLYDLTAGIVQAFDVDLEHAFFYSGLTRRTMMEALPQSEVCADIGEESGAKSVK